MEQKARFYQAKVASLTDHGIVHFLIEETDGRSLQDTSFDVLAASFLSLRLAAPLHEMVNRAELTELDEQVFARARGSRIPSDEVPGMTFWWHK